MATREMSSVVMDVPERDELSSRHDPPAHYEVKINSVTELLKLRNFELGPFEVGGYHWKLELQPRGPKIQNKEYMSLYLVMHKPNELKRDERLRVDYKFFVLNNENKYVIFKERGKELVAFSRMNTRRGLEKFLSRECLENPQKGYLDRGSCTIGAELLVSKPTREKVTLTFIPSPIAITQTIQGFSPSKPSSQYSGKFKLRETYWKLKVCPHRNEEDNWLSVHLEAQDISSTKPFFVKARLCVSNTDRNKDKKHTVTGWLNANNKTCGQQSFMRWGDLDRGFIHSNKGNKGNKQNELKLAVEILTDGTRTNEKIR